MAPLYHVHVQPSFTKVFFLLVFFALVFVPPSSSFDPSFKLVVGRRDLLEKNLDLKNQDSDGVLVSVKKKSSKGTTPYAQGTNIQNKNKTKLIKPITNSISKSSNITKSTSKTPNLSSKSSNSTKPTSKITNLIKPISKNTNSTKPISTITSLSKATSKNTNSTKPSTKTTNSTKNITKTPNPSKPTSKITTLTKPKSSLTQKSTDQEKKKSTKPGKSLTFQENDDDEDDFVSDFRDLPSKFQETLLPDLEILSTTSKAYLNKANKKLSKGFNPYVGKKYAPIIASFISFLFILIPFLLVSLIFNRIKAYFSLQKLIIFIQIYLAIYFSILSLSSLVTGLEPLKFFYATSQSTYVCIQLLQTLAYVLYLVVLLMYIVLVFSDMESSIVSKLLGLGQTFVGFAVGLHYYVTVFHRAVLRQPPKTSWKVHAVYAACFLLICLLGTAERRKKAYVVDGSEEGKKS